MSRRVSPLRQFGILAAIVAIAVAGAELIRHGTGTALVPADLVTERRHG